MSRAAATLRGHFPRDMMDVESGHEWRECECGYRFEEPESWAEHVAAQAGLQDFAEAFRRGFNAGRDYQLWTERSSDESTRPDTRNPWNGRDESDPYADETGDRS